MNSFQETKIREVSFGSTSFQARCVFVTELVLKQQLHPPSLQVFLCLQEEKFLADQKNYLDETLKRIISNNKREIAEMERECLNKKHHLIRGTVSVKHWHFMKSFLLISHVLSWLWLEREATIWDMEEKNLYERHQLLKQQLKDQYFLQRHQLLKKHEKVKSLDCMYVIMRLPPLWR